MNQRIMQVEGRSELRVAPDLAILICRLAFFATGYREAQNGLNQRVAQLRGVAAGLELAPGDFKTTDFRVDRVAEELEYKRKIQGYRARHVLRLELPLVIERVNRVVAACSASGAEPEIDVEFSVKDRESVRDRLLASAVESAKRRAEILAQAAGVKLGAIQKIDYGVVDVRVSSYSYSVNECLAEDAGPDIVPGDLDASDKVTVTWMIG